MKHAMQSKLTGIKLRVIHSWINACTDYRFYDDQGSCDLRKLVNKIFADLSVKSYLSGE
jgi:hypothetical protein